MLSRRTILGSSAAVMAAAVASLGVLVPSGAVAEAPAAAVSAFAAGDYSRAAALGTQAGTADGLALAARATLAVALLTGASQLDAASLARGRSLAERALRLQPRHVEARLQLAVALGLQARRTSPMVAYARRLPQRVKTIVDAVCAEAPGEPWGHAITGSWHLEGLRLAGREASDLLGADLASGNAAFQRATSLDPAPTFPAMHGIALLALDPVVHFAAARQPVTLAAGRRPTTAFDREMWRRADDLQGLLQRRDIAGIRARLARWL